ncbi:hypothetical protein ACS0TY_026933 [Phlomoides rotata]
MAEGESVQLFVGQVPKQMTEPQLLSMFQEFASVVEVNIIKDKATRASRGFVLTSHCMICLNSRCYEADTRISSGREYLNRYPRSETIFFSHFRLLAEFVFLTGQFDVCCQGINH